MSAQAQARQRLLVAIDRLVSEAVASHSILVSENTAATIARDHPDSGMSIDQISDQIIQKAVLAGVGLQIGHAA